MSLLWSYLYIYLAISCQSIWFLNFFHISFLQLVHSPSYIHNLVHFPISRTPHLLTLNTISHLLLHILSRSLCRASPSSLFFSLFCCLQLSANRLVYLSTPPTISLINIADSIGANTEPCWTSLNTGSCFESGNQLIHLVVWFCGVGWAVQILSLQKYSLVLEMTDEEGWIMPRRKGKGDRKMLRDEYDTSGDDTNCFEDFQEETFWLQVRGCNLI